MVISSKLKEEVTFKDNKPIINIKTNIEADLLEYNCKADFIKSENADICTFQEAVNAVDECCFAIFKSKNDIVKLEQYKYNEFAPLFVANGITKNGVYTIYVEDNNGNTYLKVNIPIENPIEYVDYKKIIKTIENQEDAVVFFGYAKDCHHCRTVA